jgi:hypothetical protein
MREPRFAGVLTRARKLHATFHVAFATFGVAFATSCVAFAPKAKTKGGSEEPPLL